MKLSGIVLLLLFLVIGCQKDNLEYADDNIEIFFEGGISIYKTDKNYFNYISLQLTDEGKPNAVPSYYLNDRRVSINNEDNIEQNFRWRLRSGYILDTEASFNDVFTNISISEYVKYNLKHKVNHWPNNLILPRIIQTDPYIEYYHSNSTILPELITIGEINKMIENATFENYFTKIK